MAATRVLAERLEQGVAKLTLNNPPLNLVTLEMTVHLMEVFDVLEGDETVRAVVVTGAGEKAFCAGSDVGEFADVRDRVVEKKLARENETFGRFEFLSKPVIAAIEGPSYGGGCEISMVCDLRITGQGAKLALPEVRLGVVPGSGGLFRLPELVGPARAMELMYLGEPITAGKAGLLGLVNEVVPDGESLHSSREHSVRLTLELSDHLFRTEDCEEGIAAFFEKREPRFGGLPGPAMRPRFRGFVSHGLPCTHGKDRIDDVERGKGP